METPQLLKLFEQYSTVKEMDAGETVFEQGDGAEAMYVVLEGAVDLAVDGEVLDTAEPGQIFGEMALVDDEGRSATATAKERTLLAVVNERRFRFLVQEHPFFALHVMRVLASRVRRTNTMVVA